MAISTTLIDAVGNPAGAQAGLQWLAAGPFKERDLKIALRNNEGAPRTMTHDTLMTARAKAGSMSA